MIRLFPEKRSKNWLFFFLTVSVVLILTILIRIYITNDYSLTIGPGSVPYILSYAVIPAIIISAAGYYGFIAVSTLTLSGTAAGLLAFLYTAIRPGQYRTFDDLAGAVWFVSLGVLGFAIGVFIEIVLFIYRRLRH